MHDDEKLSPDLVWHADGHLTEIALTALGDGEEAILPEGAASHAAGCEACSAALGRAALLSLRTGEALREARAVVIANPVEQPPRPAPPLPTKAILLALSIAALGAAPGLVAEAGRLPETAAQIGRALTVVLRAGRTVVESGAFGARGWIATLMWISAAVLLFFGLAVARARGESALTRRWIVMGPDFNRRWLPRIGRMLLSAAVGLSVAGAAQADVTRKGDWPESDRAVSLELDRVPRNEALKRLANEAGWSLGRERAEGRSRGRPCEGAACGQGARAAPLRRGVRREP